MDLVCLCVGCLRLARARPCGRLRKPGTPTRDSTFAPSARAALRAWHKATRFGGLKRGLPPLRSGAADGGNRVHCANPEQSEPPRIMETPMGAAEDAELETTSPLAPRVPAPHHLHSLPSTTRERREPTSATTTARSSPKASKANARASSRSCSRLDGGIRR